jgi:hypothetical protein
MKIDRVTATIKYSQDTGKGAWRAVEVGAEAAVDARETWQTAQASLYAELGQQLKALWANGNGKPAQNGAERPVEPAQPPEPTETPAHFCQEHQTAFKQHSRGEAAWWSHKTADGKWCREK